jgi:hypothetical protein
LHRPT